MDNDLAGNAHQDKAGFEAVVVWALQVGSRRAATECGPFTLVLLARVQEDALVDEIEVGLAPDRRSAYLLDSLAQSVLDDGTADFAIVVSRVAGNAMDVHVRSESHEMLLVARPDERGLYRPVESSIVRRRRLEYESLLS